jgi:Carboxypeptidase regulatory-like domain
MRPILTCAILLLGIAPGHAQAPPQTQNIPPGPKPTPTARLTGHILCADTRGPARGAMVTLEQLDVPSDRTQTTWARTNIEGSYTIEHITPGSYVLFAALPGYLSTRSDADFDLDDRPGQDAEAATERRVHQLYAPQNFIQIASGEAATANLVLQRAAAISGRVIYSDGTPATQVNISVEDTQKKHDNGFEFSRGFAMFTGQRLTTDDEGHYRINGISPGTYRVVALQPLAITSDAMHPIGPNPFGPSDPHQVRFFAGDTYHQKEAKTYELRSGDNLRDIDIRLPIDGFHTIRVHLTANDGRPINSADLTLNDSADDTLKFLASTHGVGNPDGIFEFTQVPPGTYTLTSIEARITVETPPSESENEQFEPIHFHPTNAFADGSMTIILKDSDLLDLTFTLAEVPLPAKPAPPTP